MNISCPQCSTTFSVPENAIPKTGRQVRCSVCQHVWNAVTTNLINEESNLKDTFSQESQEKKISKALDDLSPFSVSKKLHANNLSTHKTKKRTLFQKITKCIVTLLSWGIVLGSICYGGYALYVFRAQIISYYPPFANVYQQLGLWKIPGYGLVISVPNTEAQRNGKQIVLSITGTILNNNRTETHVPELKGILQDSHGKTLYTWFFHADTNLIPSLQTSTYHTIVQNPPIKTQTLSIQFVRNNTQKTTNKNQSTSFSKDSTKK